MTYDVEIIEGCSLVKQVEATSPADAEKFVRALLEAGELVVHNDGQNETKVKVLGESGSDRKPAAPVNAVYVKSGGRWQLVATFAAGEKWETRWDGDVSETFAENLRSEGEEVIVMEVASLAEVEPEQPAL